MGHLGNILRLVTTARSEGITTSSSCDGLSRLRSRGASTSSRVRFTVVRGLRAGVTFCSAFRRSTRFLDSARSSSGAGHGRTSSSDSFSSVVFVRFEGAADTRDALVDLRLEEAEGDGDGALLDLTARDGVLRAAGAGLLPFVLVLAGVLTVEVGVV